MNQQKSKILVPIGFSEQSLLALDTAILYGTKSKSEIVLLSIIEEESMISKLFSSEVHPEEKKKKVLVEKLEQIIAEKQKTSDLEFSYMVTTGVVYEEITRVSEMIDAEMVVMGTNGRPSNFRKKMIGTNAYKTVARVKPPVITVNGIIQTGVPKNIICPIILDRKSKEKIGPAMHYARLFGAKIWVVAVSDSKEKELKLAPHVKQVHKFVTSKGIPCESNIIRQEKQKLHEAVLDYSQKVSGDLVMIMEDSDESSLRLFGNDTEKFLHYSPIPVMCVTPSFTKYENMFANW